MAQPVPVFDPAHPDARSASQVAGALYGQQLLAQITQQAQGLGLDPRVALAVAPHEGGFEGAIGDSGTSFGPWQLHAGGALPQSVWAQGANYARQWANSPEGIAYALRGIKSAIGGAQGPQAVAAVVRDFERPASQYVDGEVAKALSTYGAPAGVYTQLTQQPAAPATAPTAAPAVSPTLGQQLSPVAPVKPVAPVGRAISGAGLNALVNYLMGK